MSEEKRKLQIKELENVAGGQWDDPWMDKISCDNCDKIFYLDTVPKKEVKDGCGNTFFVYQCPNCKALVNEDGEVYEEA